MIYPNYQGEVLEVGSKGGNVENIKAAINVLLERYPVYHKLEIKDNFDSEMEKSVKEIQRAVDLEVNGKIDEKTWKTIFEIANFISPNKF